MLIEEVEIVPGKIININCSPKIISTHNWVIINNPDNFRHYDFKCINCDIYLYQLLINSNNFYMIIEDHLTCGEKLLQNIIE